jgi:hypothetical protein
MGNVSAWLIPILVSVGVPGIVAVLIRLFPKKKLMEMTVPWSRRIGVGLSKILLVRIGKKAAESVEEGIFVTIATVLYANIDSFMKGLLSDNTETGK